MLRREDISQCVVIEQEESQGRKKQRDKHLKRNKKHRWFKKP